jgi:hypothetical protein
VEGEVAPEHRDLVRLGRRLDGAQTPAVDVREQLLAAYVDRAQARPLEAGGELVRGEGVNVDLALELVAGELLGGPGEPLVGLGGAYEGAPQRCRQAAEPLRK